MLDKKKLHHFQKMDCLFVFYLRKIRKKIRKTQKKNLFNSKIKHYLGIFF